MASVTKSNEEKSEADEELPDEEQQAPQRPRKKASAEKGRAPEPRRKVDAPFFTIYKRGQGYWTRVGTVVGVALVGGFTALNLFHYIPTFLPESVNSHRGRSIALGVALGFAAAYAFIAWKLMNKPTNVDFLIATDSEMKKVNWTSRKELIGSTKVVVIFMALMAVFLFVCDILFSELFKLMHVLKFGYFGS
jgi:preprotein translocase SecE subunit